MATVPLASYAVLGIQAACAGHAVRGVYHEGQEADLPHGTIMAILVVVNIITVVAVMTPTFYDMAPAPGAAGASLLLAHHYLGLLAIILTSVVAFTWVLRGAKDKGCLGTGRRGRTIMRTTLVVWTASLLLGMAYFIAGQGDRPSAARP